MKKLLLIGCLIVAMQTHAQEWSKKVAETAMTIWKDSFMLPGDKAPKWRYDQGVILKGIEGIWNATGDGRYFDYIRRSMDYYVSNDGMIRGYKKDEFNIDHVNNGKLLLLLFRVTGKDKYRKAAEKLRDQLRDHPRTSEGGFWHKKIYEHQMWLDGLYMGQPFYAEYAMLFHDGAAFDDITRQFVLMEQHARDGETGLLYHGWDESRQQKWADKTTGRSPHFWGRALGWYGMAMVDVLDYFPEKHPGRDSIIAILDRFAKAVTKVQDAKTGLWYDIVDKPKEPKNYFEASASSMLVYTLAKAVRMGYLPASYLAIAKKGYNGIVKRFIKTENGQVNLHGTVAVSGLGGKPYRDGSFEYYMSEPVVVNDPKGIGAFINAAVEMEMAAKTKYGKGKVVLLDRYFNSEKKKDGAGKEYYWHYVWEEKSNPGFSFLGNIFRTRGAALASLDEAPTSDNLRKASVYIIVDPDHVKDNPTPNYITDEHARLISNWVKNGGVLIMMANDSANCDLKHFNKLAGRFGIEFLDTSLNMVKNDEYETGAVNIPSKSLISVARKIFIKEISELKVRKPAIGKLWKDGKPVIAEARCGKGYVFAIGDPWLYNEYLDGRRLPDEFDNYEAAVDFVNDWLRRAKKK